MKRGFVSETGCLCDGSSVCRTTVKDIQRLVLVGSDDPGFTVGAGGPQGYETWSETRRGVHG